MAVVAFLIQTALYLGIVIYAPALALANTTGMDLWGAVVGTGLVCTLYTTLGGMKAVIWTSVFQAIIMLAGFAAVIIYGAADIGLGEVFAINSRDHRLDLLETDPDPRQRHTIWSILIAGQTVWLSLYATSQAQVQRYMSSKSLKVRVKKYLCSPGNVRRNRGPATSEQLVSELRTVHTVATIRSVQCPYFLILLFVVCSVR